MPETPAHLKPEACYVCGHGEHPDGTANGGHRFWSNTAAEAANADLFDQPTVHSPEAAYVAEHRPY